MLIKRLSKIGLTLLLAVSFIMPVSFNARADFGSTDSNNLKEVKENTANTVTRLGTTNSWLSQIKTELVSLNTEVSNIKTAVANTITTTLNQINTKVGNIYSAVDSLEGYLDTVETKLADVSDWLDTVNGNIVTMGGYVQAINNNESANGTTLTNIYNLLNTYTNGYLRDIRSGILIIKDNFTRVRTSDTQSTITVDNNATLGAVSYPLFTTTFYTYTTQNGQIVGNGVTKYVNFAGLFHYRLGEVRNIIGIAGNLLASIESLIALDTQYIGEESHLIYQKLDSFKSANHTDITNFASANHTDITTFNSAFNTWASKWPYPMLTLYVIRDNVTIRRVSNTQDTITLQTALGDVEYTLFSFNQKYLSYQNSRLVVSDNTKYVNLLGLLNTGYVNMTNSIVAIGQYLTDASPAQTITNSVATLDQNLTNLNNAETAASSDAISRINSFVPNVSDISSLVALSWCSTFLQNLYLALGTFNIPILCGLVLAVCMQFIGYFRYKT